MTLLICIDAEISILLCQGFLEKNTICLLSDKLGHIFDYLYRASILGQDYLGYPTVYNISTMMWATFQSHETMEDFYKHKMILHLSIKSIFFYFLITDTVFEPLQEIDQVKGDIKVLITKSSFYHGRLTKLKEWR